MEEQQQQQRKNSRLRTLIIILVILLLLSLTALAGTLIYRSFAPAGPGSVVVPDNIIAPDGDVVSEEQCGIEDTGESRESSSESGTEENAQGENTDMDGLASGGGQGITDVGQSTARTATALYLYNKNTGDNTPFLATNMFPGDVERKYFCVSVSYEDAVTVKFHADIHPGSEKLAEVLKCRIVLLNTGQTMYDGLMRDMPASLDHTLASAAETTDELYYEITAYLDTSVGNAYQNKSLTANFRWWVEDGKLTNPPKTGDDFNTALWIGLLGASLSALILLLVIRRKEAQNEQ